MGPYSLSSAGKNHTQVIVLIEIKCPIPKPGILKWKKNLTVIWWLWLWTIKSHSEWSKTHSAISFPAQLILLLTYLIMTGLGQLSHCISCPKQPQRHLSPFSPNCSMYLLFLWSINCVRLEWFGTNGFMFCQVSGILAFGISLPTCFSLSDMGRGLKNEAKR